MLQAGQILRSQYQIQRILGQGGMGGVYLATYVDRPVSVAIKEMLIHFPDPEQQDMAVRQFLEEARLLYSLTHPRLPRMYDFFEEQGTWFLVMDFVEGSTLEHYLESDGPLGEESARLLMGELADVLGYMHGQRKPVIFRDLKPSNIMIDRSGHIKLIDFGIAKLFHHESGKTNTLIRSAGTSGFAAPEQYGAGTDERSDIYSLGATMYNLLTNVTPPASPVLAVGADELVPLSQLRPDLSLGMVALVQHLMQLMPGERPASMREVAHALQQVEAYPHQAPVPVQSHTPTLVTPSTSTPVPTAPGPATATPAGRKTPVLLLVGFEQGIDEWRAAAQGTGHRLGNVRGPDEAIQFLATSTPTGVLLHLTRQFDWEATCSLAHRCQELGTPFYVVADEDMAVARLAITQLGCQLFCRQPIKPPQVLANVEAVQQSSNKPAPLVMALDDDDVTLTAMEGILDMYGLPFHGLNDPTAFWTTLEAVHPDFLILDLEMPDITGLEVCRMVRTDARWRNIPILILTAAATDADLIHSVYQAGADDFASKPIFGEQLVTRIRNRLHRCHTLSTPVPV